MAIFSLGGRKETQTFRKHIIRKMPQISILRAYSPIYTFYSPKLKIPPNSWKLEGIFWISFICSLAEKIIKNNSHCFLIESFIFLHRALKHMRWLVSCTVTGGYLYYNKIYFAYYLVFEKFYLILKASFINRSIIALARGLMTNARRK